MTLLAMLALLLVSALVSGSETAVFSLRVSERRSLSEKSPLLGRLLAQPARLLVTLLLTNLLVNVAYFTLSARWSLALVQEGRELASVGVALGSLVGLVVLGEILPKTAALASAPALVQRLTPALGLLMSVLAPLVLVGAWLTELLQALLLSTAGSRRVDRRDYKSMFAGRTSLGGFHSVELALLHDVIDFGERRARNFMVPRVDMVVLDLAQDRSVWLETMARRPFTDYPVVAGSPDDVVGLMNTARLLEHPERDRAELVEPALLAPLGISAERLVMRMQEEKRRVGILVDEFGGVAGLVGLAQLTRAVLGELETLESGPVQRLPRGAAVVAGSCPLHQLSEELGFELPARRADTVGGAVVEHLARLPRRGDELVLSGWRVRVVSVQGTRVTQVLVRPELHHLDEPDAGAVATGFGESVP